MFQNYFKTAWRNIKKNKTFSVINIAGLAIGMAACLLILQYVNFELSYDQFNKNGKDLYRITNDRYQNGKLIQHGIITYSGVSKAMEDDYPEVINHARVEPFGVNVISYQEKKFNKEKIIAIDNSFLKMFSYPILTGDKNTALAEPYTTMISETTARKFFDIHDNDLSKAIGKTIMVGTDSSLYKVTAVCKDVPENSHLQFDILVSYITLYKSKYPYTQADYDFKQSNFFHYIQLNPGANYKALNAKLGAFSDKYFQGNKVSGSVEKFFLQPVSKVHLYSDYEYEIGKTGSATVMWGLLIIACFIIVIAWVNYINLSTARSAERAKEVGVRKVTGASQQQLIRQFLTESLIVNMIALVLALALVWICQQPFNILIQHELSFASLFQKSLGGYSITIGLLSLILIGIFISGFYPAFVLSSFRPILVLKGKFSSSKKGIMLRKGLVVGQFAITIALMIGSFVVYKQVRFMSTQELGININQVMVLNPPMFSHFDSSFVPNENSFKTELRKMSGIENVATSNSLVGGEMSRAFDVHRTDDNSGNVFTVRNMGADFDYLDLYGIKLLAGRKLSSADYHANYKDLHNVLINSSAVKLLSFTSNENAVGKSIILNGKQWDIIGVINDFHQKSLRYPLEPIVLQPFYGTFNPISIKLNTSGLQQTIASIKTKYDAYFPGNLFYYTFLDERFNNQYKNDLLFGKAFGLFAGLAILIACLGLLGLSLFATAQRIKEIGIRKILGASVSNIVLLLSKDFIRLVLIAFLIASPLAWYVMHTWLQDFAYRIPIEWPVFAIAGLLSVTIALATISMQAIQAALSNPVKSLRTE